MPLDLEDKLELLKQAREAQNNAYAPYSGFMVGAALLCADKSVYKGCRTSGQRAERDPDRETVSAADVDRPFR